MRFKLPLIFLLLLSTLFTFSQSNNYLLIEKLRKNLEECKAYEVKRLKIKSKKYEYTEINNPEYIEIKGRIDSIKQEIVEIEKSKLSNAIKKTKISDLSSESRALSLRLHSNSIGKNIVREKIYAHIPTTDIEREVLIIDSINVLDDLKGSFITQIIELSDNDDYRIMNENKLYFLKNEIVTKKVLQRYFNNDYYNISTELGYFYKQPIKLIEDYNFLNGKNKTEISETRSYLIKSNQNNNIYYVTNNFLEKGSIEEDTYKFLKNIDDFGIDLTQKENEIYIEKNGKKCILTYDIQNSIIEEKDANIIEKINNSVIEWRNLYDKQSKIAVNLTKHLQAHKSRLMTKERLSTWKKETTDCILLQEKINKLPFVLTNGLYKQLNTKEIQVQSGILDIMNESRNVLGI